jgi:hypothetical protein
MLRRFRPSPAMIVACIALVVALGGSAYALSSFVGPNGQIHGCVDNTGNLSVVKPGKQCPSGRSPLLWNQKSADVIARIHGGPVTVPANTLSKSVPVNPSTFGQGMGNAILLVGSLTFTPPATSCGTFGTFNFVQVALDGVQIMSAPVLGTGPGARTVYFTTAGLPGGPGRTRAPSVTANNTCSDASQSYTINSLSLNAIRMR